jgi:hypothetical protein
MSAGSVQVFLGKNCAKSWKVDVSDGPILGIVCYSALHGGGTKSMIINDFNNGELGMLFFAAEGDGVVSVANKRRRKRSRDFHRLILLHMFMTP